jgi:hypothetical protein
MAFLVRATATALRQQAQTANNNPTDPKPNCIKAALTSDITLSSGGDWFKYLHHIRYSWAKMGRVDAP